MSSSSVVEGYGLHSGRASRLVFERASGATTIATREAEATIDELVVVDAVRSTTVATRDGRLRVATVEHSFAAMAGLFVRSGLRVTVDGPEVPLVDGGARVFADAIVSLGVREHSRAQTRSLRVVREGTIAIDASMYEFAVGDDVAIEVVFDDPRFGATASWNGDAADFRERIAPARTFGFAREVDELAARGLAKHVAPESVVALTENEALFAGAAFERDEPARHKLLDLLGDLFVHGGPARGKLRALRPGHASTHAAIARAMATGIVRIAG